jgi:uncharacterized repeat protein (TIGR01451 family)
MNDSHKTPNRKPYALFWAGFLGVILAILFLQSARGMGDAQEIIYEGPDAILANLAVETVVDTPRDNNQVQPGGTLTYTIRYTNTTGSSIANVIISDSLSSYQVFDGSYTSFPNIPLNQFSNPENLILEWQLPTLGPNASGTIIFHTRVITYYEPGEGKPIRFLGNAVKIFSTQSSITGSQDDTVAVLSGPILSLSKIVNPNPVLPGHILDYAITVANLVRQDSLPANNIVVSDTLPGSTTFLDAGQGGSFDEETNLVTWHLVEPLSPGQEVIVTFRVVVNVDAPTDSNIANTKTSYRASSDEIKLLAVNGKVNANVKVASLLQKAAIAENMLGTTPSVFPTEEVTYTITVHNPHNEPISGVIVTDTLPGDPLPFTYVRPAYGSPAPAQILNAGRDLVWVVDLPAWGYTQVSFVVSIPRKTIVDDNKTYKYYYNELNGYHPEIPFSLQDELARVRVNAALVMDKEVTPSTIQAGLTVYYTITLENLSPYTINNIRLTDTIAGDPFFGTTHYLYMTYGPEPLAGYQYNPIIWEPLSVRAGEVRLLSFAAYADGSWTGKYCNSLSASSPDAHIPARNGRSFACITIDPPIRINKTVDPEEVYPGAEVEYEISLLNVSDVGDSFTLDRVEDYLPEGFYQVGGSNGNPAVININPAYTIGPGGEWIGRFTARVTTDIGCENLPETYYNERGAVMQHYTQPFDFWAGNATKLAPLVINPHVTTDLIPYRSTVTPGSFVTYTFRLTNGSPNTITSGKLVLTLPLDSYNAIRYIRMIDGKGPSSITVDSKGRDVITWSGLTLSSNSNTDIVFLVQVVPDPDQEPTTNTRTYEPELQTSANNGCLGKLGTGPNPLGEGKIKVDPYPVALTKKALSTWVPVDSFVEYDLEINNKDGYAYVIDSLIDTIPAGFTYDSMIIGNEPTYNPDTRQLIWSGLTFNPGKTKWKLRLRSSALFGDYTNRLSAIDDELYFLPAYSKPVSVVPVIGIIKRAAVDVAFPGSVVPYTITLINVSDTDYGSVTVTDTLPTGFTYLRMSPEGDYPAPISLGPGGAQPVWANIDLPNECGEELGCTVELAFWALIGNSVPDGVYWNNITAHSPDGSFPNILPSAPISVTRTIGGGNLIYLPIILR